MYIYNNKMYFTVILIIILIFILFLFYNITSYDLIEKIKVDKKYTPKL